MPSKISPRTSQGSCEYMSITSRECGFCGRANEIAFAKKMCMFRYLASMKRFYHVYGHRLREYERRCRRTVAGAGPGVKQRRNIIHFRFRLRRMIKAGTWITATEFMLPKSVMNEENSDLKNPISYMTSRMKKRGFLLVKQGNRELVWRHPDISQPNWEDQVLTKFWSFVVCLQIWIHVYYLFVYL